MSKDQKDIQYWAVLDAVIRLEVSRGHLKWKLTEVARLSGVGRPLIYYYFGKSKPEIVHAALKIIGDEFFGLSAERMRLWETGQVAESIFKTRELMLRAPHIAQFYFHWRHQKSEVGQYFRSLEKRYLNKLAKLNPNLSNTEIEGLFAVFFGLILLPDLKAETIRAVVARALPMR